MYVNHHFQVMRLVKESVGELPIVDSELRLIEGDDEKKEEDGKEKKVAVTDTSNFGTSAIQYNYSPNKNNL